MERKDNDGAQAIQDTEADNADNPTTLNTFLIS